jgi:DNA-binding response OmpR family regulator
MNGIDLARSVKLISPQTRVLLLSGALTDEIQAQVHLAQIEYVLGKPFTLDQFQEIVRTILTDTAR